jgi:glutathione S-transferase
METDEGKKTEIKKNIQSNVLPKAWGKFNDILKQNGSGVLVGKNVSYADIYVAFMVEWLSTFLELTEKMSDYPELLGHQKKIMGLSGIKEWIVKRPATDF